MGRYKIILKKMLNIKGKHYAMYLQYIRGDFKHQYINLSTIENFVKEYKRYNSKDDLINFTITDSGRVRIKSDANVDIEELPRVELEKQFLYYDRVKVNDIYEDIVSKVGEIKGGNLRSVKLFYNELPAKYTLKEIEYKYQGELEGELEDLDSFIENGNPKIATIDKYYNDGLKEFYLADIYRYTKNKDVIEYLNYLKEIQWLDNMISHTRYQVCKKCGNRINIETNTTNCPNCNEGLTIKGKKEKLENLYHKREEFYSRVDEIGAKLGTTNLDNIIKIGGRKSGYIVILVKVSLVKE